MATVRARIRRILPPELRNAWALLHRGTARGEDEREAERATEWIGRYGQQHGFRPPNLGERSRVTGSACYLESLGLTPRALFDGQGNHFDRHVIPCRVSRPIVRWVRGENVPGHAYPAVNTIEDGYQRLRATVEAEGVPAQGEGVPREVRSAAALGWRRAIGGSAAAESGRGTR